MFKIFDFDFDIFVFVESLFEIVDFGLIRLDLVVVISEEIVESFDLFTERLILSFDFDISTLLFFEGSELLLNFWDVEFEFFIVFDLRVKFIF